MTKQGCLYMPRKPRFYLPGVPAHIVQRGNSRQAAFFQDSDYSNYLVWLREGAAKYGCAIHSYVLMTNHVHLLMTPKTRHSISQTIQHVGRHYVTYVNATYNKSGTLWEGRHKGCIIDSEQYLFACMRYIEMNPVRACMVKRPADYRWSSYAANAVGKHDKVVTPHSLYSELAINTEQRLCVYRDMFKQLIDSDNMDDIRATVQTGTPLGNAQFREQIEETLGRQVGQARRGRPSR